MQQLMERFCDTLESEREVHRELLEFSERKRTAITSNDVPTLDKIVKNEEVLLSRLNHLEKKRMDCVRDLATHEGRPAREIILQDFLELCDETQRNRLHELHLDLKSLLERQIAINETNKRLVESRLEYIRFSLETATGEGQSAYQTYEGGHERAASTRKTSFIDQLV